jgi:predicted O-methyltransferase YrrM
MKAVGVPPGKFLAQARIAHPELVGIEEEARRRVHKSKREVSPYQAAAIYLLARRYDGGRALEIGTAFGYSCFFIASAMPRAKQIVTLNPSMKEYWHAVKALLPFGNVAVLALESRHYLDVYGDGGAPLDFIFVDGHHEAIGDDLPWFRHLATGGLILFHDYSPEGSWRPCPGVMEAVDEFARRIGRPEPDVLVVDDGGAGMAGFYRREGDEVP